MVNVVEWTRLEPWRVARGRTDRDETVIVKWMGPHVGTKQTKARRLRAEVAALRFLSEDLGVQLAPRVLAEDLPAGRIILEDLAPRTALDGLLRRDGADAHAERLVAFARARGELGAVSAGRAELYYRRRGRLGEFDAEFDARADRLGRVARLRQAGLSQAEEVGVPVGGAVEHELAVALEVLAEPGPFLVLSNGDPEANNVLVHAAGTADARLIDFEFAGFTHALHDAACLHVPGPAWMSVGVPGQAPLPDVAEVYRSALAAGVPEAEDERRYGTALAAACVAYALARLWRLPALDARPAGDDSRTQLVAILEAAARTARAHRALPRLAGLCCRLAEAVRRRWPDADVDVAAMAPYTPRRR